MHSVWLLSLVWEPIASPLKIGAGAAMMTALAVFAYVRIWRDHSWAATILLVMRLAMIAAVTAILFGPSRERSRSAAGTRPRLTILVDTSESMQTTDCNSQSRLQHVAREILSPSRLQKLRAQFDIDLQSFDQTTRPLASTTLHDQADQIANGKATLLADCVRRTLTRLRGGSVGEFLMVIGDGRDTEDAPIQPAAELAAAKGIPVFTVGVGGHRSETDAALLAIPMQDTLLPGEPGGILIKVYQSGLEGRQAVVRLKSSTESQSVTIDFRDQPIVETQFRIEREEPGQYEFEVLLEPSPGEADITNNSQTVFVEVLSRKIRVLLLEGEPFWDTKFLAQSLRKDEQVELVQVTQVGTGKRESIVSRRSESAAGVPETVGDWGEFDIVIFGRGVERLVSRTAAAALAQHVAEGGGQVIFARGPAWNANEPAGLELEKELGVIEPVVWSSATEAGGQVALTPSGRTSAWFAPTKMGTDVESALQRLPGFEEQFRIQRGKSGALVLAQSLDAARPTAEPRPAICRMSYGRGQSVAILGTGLWRWSLLPPELQDLRGFYDVFWSNLIRWLALGGDFAPGQQVSVQLSRQSLRLGDELTLDVVYRQPLLTSPPTLQIQSPDGTEHDVALHELPGQAPRFRATFSPEQTGVHTLSVQSPGMTPAQLDKRCNVYEVRVEKLQTAANSLPLQILAEHSGGTMFDDQGLGEITEKLQQHRDALLIPPRREYLWDRGLIMTLLLGWAGVEWLFRRAAGLW
ncbi:MAG: hypothetical protein ACK5Q5_19760 [Planctomycetaceae bacterium]